MAEHDLEHYLDDQAAFDALSDEDKARLFTGDSSTGETDAALMAEASAASAPDGMAEDGGEAPGAAAERERGAERDGMDRAVADGDKPVVLARDGRHTIPYEALLAARERAQQMEGIAREQAAMIERMRQGSQVADAQAGLEAMEREYLERVMNGDRDGAVRVRAGINAEIRRHAEREAASHALEQTAQAVTLHEAQRLLNETAQRTLAAYPFLNDNEAALAEVVEWRDFYMMKGAAPHHALEQAAARVAPAWQPPQLSAGEVGRRAAAAVTSARAQMPLSLSDMPAGSAAAHDEVAALREMSGAGLMQRFAGKTPEQIMELMNRLI